MARKPQGGTSPEVARHAHFKEHGINPHNIQEAVFVIDRALVEFLPRELVSTGEVTDLLLDVRLLLCGPPTQEPSAPLPPPSPVDVALA